MPEEAREIITGRINQMVGLVIIEALLLAVLFVMAYVLPHLLAVRIIFLLLLAAGSYGVMAIMIGELRRLRSDLDGDLIVERCRMIRATPIARTTDEAWRVETVAGQKKELINATGIPGTPLRGQWIDISYTRHMQLIVQVA